ncbi:MAG: YfhO family protein [Vicinamibacteria bacterium]
MDPARRSVLTLFATVPRAMMSNRRVLATGLVVVFAALEFYLRMPVLLGHAALFDRDLFLLYYPLVHSVLRVLSEGALPFRDPTSAFGQSILGDPESQILYPLTWLNLVLPTHVAYAWFVSIQTVFGALGIALLTRRLSGGSVVAALVGGLLWISSGPLQSLATLWHHMSGAAWIAWVLLGVERVLEERTLRSAVVLGATLGAQILAGSADMCAMTILFALLRIMSESGWRAWRWWMISAAVALALGTGVWLPAAESVLTSGRAALPQSTRTFWSLHPLATLEFFLPLPLSLLPLKPIWKAAFFESREPFLGSMFLGAAMLPLFVSGLFDSFVAWRARVAYGIAALGGLLVAFGKNSIAYSVLVTILPPLAVLRYPSKAMVPVTVAMCVLGGIGASALGRSWRSRVAAVVSSSALAGIALLLIGPARGVFEATLFDPQATFAMAQVQNNLSQDLCVTIGAMILMIASAWGPWRKTFLALLLLVTLRQSAYLLGDLNPTIRPEILAYKPEHIESIRPREGRVFVYDYGLFEGLAKKHLGTDGLIWSGLEKMGPDEGRVVATHASLGPLSGGLWGFEYAWDADLRLLLNRRLAKLTSGLRSIEDTPGFLKLLQISGVERVVAFHDAGIGGLNLLFRKRVFHKEDLRVFEVPSTLPRAHLTSGRRTASGSDMNDFLDPSFDPRTTVLVDGPLARAASRDYKGAARILEKRADRLTIDVESNAPGFLSLTEGALPGWRAWVDGHSVPVERANAIFIGTEVPAGHHHVEFRFLPASGIVGVSVTGVAAFALLAWILLSRPSAPRVSGSGDPSPPLLAGGPA